MYKLQLRPDADGYNSVDGESVLRVQLDGGAGRYRTDKIGATKTVTATWTMHPTQYQYWRAFYETGTKRGALPFLCDLVSDDGTGPAEHVCNFIPGSVSLPTQKGFTYVQQATLEVKPLPRDKNADLALINIWEAAGPEPELWLNELEKLVNVTMPENIGG